MEEGGGLLGLNRHWAGSQKKLSVWEGRKVEVWSLKNLGRKNITIIVALGGRHGRAGGGGGCGGGGGLGGRDHLPVAGNVDVGRGGARFGPRRRSKGGGAAKTFRRR